MVAVTLGEFEQVVLLAIMRLGEQAYGVSVRDEIAACTDRRPERYIRLLIDWRREAL